MLVRADEQLKYFSLMKNIFALLVAVLFSAFSATSQAEGVFIRSDVGAYSWYASSSSGKIKYDGWLPQQQLSGIYETGDWKFRLKVWNSASLNGVPDKGDETDYGFDVTKKLGNFSVNAGYVYFDMTGPDLHDLFVVVDFPKVAGVTPFITLEDVLPTKKEILPGGFLYKVGAKAVVPVAGQPFSLKGYFGGHDGAFGSVPEHPSMFLASVATTIKAGDFSLTPEIRRQWAIKGVCPDKTFYGLTATYLIKVK